MFGAPTKTLQTSLHNLFDNAHEFASDVYFDHPVARIYAHKAILLARIPEEFRHRQLNGLTDLQGTRHDPQALKVDSRIPFDLLRAIIRFWYTAEFCERDSSPLSRDATASSDSSHQVKRIRSDVVQLEKQLGASMLPHKDDSLASDFDQLVQDLQRMYQEQIAPDVFVQITATPKEPKSVQPQSQDQTVPSILFTRTDLNQQQPIPAHRVILASQSSYFFAIFCGQFREASSSTVHLPNDLFSPTTVQVILNYFYTDTLVIPPLSTTVSLRTPAQRQFSHKKHSLRVLHHVFSAADYLGHFDTICRSALNAMYDICHHFRCVCSDCALLLPSMLLFASKHICNVPTLYSTLINLYADPVHSIASLWSQKPFAILVGSFAQPVLAPSSDSSSSPSTLVTDISTKTFERITKHNAVFVLHALHLCLSQIRSADPFPTWSNPTLNLLNTILSHTVTMVSDNFDFYCDEYPILISCVDGMGFSFSVDFLDFLLERVLEDGIRDDNAGILYQGIVRDLIGRNEAVPNVALEGVLADARHRCAAYLSQRWTQVKAANGFKSLDKETLRQLSEDIGVAYRMLSKPIASDFSAIFSFHPKAAFKQRHNEPKPAQATLPSRTTPRRLSLSSLKSYRSSSALKTHEKLTVGRRDSSDAPRSGHQTRARSLSNEFTRPPHITKDLSSESIDCQDKTSHSNQPFAQILSLSSETGLQHHELPSTIPNSSSTYAMALADALLPMDTVGSMYIPPAAEQSPRPSRLKFELPATPTRAKSPKRPLMAGKGRYRRGQSPRMRRWGLGSSGSEQSDDEELESPTRPPLGTKVALLRRPLPTLGVIKYIGDVSFAKGTWVGVELENRLGKNDGAVDGIRYFQTDPQRGVFVKVDDFRVLDLPRNTQSPRTAVAS